MIKSHNNVKLHKYEQKPYDNVKLHNVKAFDANVHSIILNDINTNNCVIGAFSSVH